jgi:hypothetical protein
MRSCYVGVIEEGRRQEAEGRRQEAEENQNQNGNQNCNVKQISPQCAVSNEVETK